MSVSISNVSVRVLEHINLKQTPNLFPFSGTETPRQSSPGENTFNNHRETVTLSLNGVQLKQQQHVQVSRPDADNLINGRTLPPLDALTPPTRTP